MDYSNAPIFILLLGQYTFADDDDDNDGDGVYLSSIRVPYTFSLTF